MLLLFTVLGLLVCTTAQSKLYVLDKSRSPNGRIVFAINYPPTSQAPDEAAQGCFVDARSKRCLSQFFFLDGTDAEFDHPGTYSFDAYHVFDYVWSADSTHVAIVHNERHFSEIYPFRRQGAAFQSLQMPDLVALIHQRLAGTIERSNAISVKANRWAKKHCLVATIAQDAKLTDTGDQSSDWKAHTLECIISFDGRGKPAVDATKFHVGE